MKRDCFFLLELMIILGFLAVRGSSVYSSGLDFRFEV